MNVYTLTDPDGLAHTLSPIAPVVTYEQRIDSPAEGVFVLGAALGDYVPCVVQMNYADLDGYDDQLLARWKITRTVVELSPPDQQPPGVDPA